MSELPLKEHSYLVFKQKEIQFEIPDDFPIDQIPKFSSLTDFEIWYKKQGFMPYRVTDEDTNTTYLLSSNKYQHFIDFEENNATEYQHGCKMVLDLIKEIQTYQHLFVGQSLPEKLLSVFPEQHIKLLSKIILPINTFQKLKSLLITKYPNKKLIDLIKDYIDINEISEQFTEFLSLEKADLSAIKFYESNFTYPSSFEEKEDWYASFDNPPFSARKTELLLKMCQKKINKDDVESVKNKLKEIIETNQLVKVKVVLECGELPKSLLQDLIEEIPSLTLVYRSLIVNAIK